MFTARSTSTAVAILAQLLACSASFQCDSDSLMYSYGSDEVISGFGLRTLVDDTPPPAQVRTFPTAPGYCGFACDGLPIMCPRHSDGRSSILAKFISQMDECFRFDNDVSDYVYGTVPPADCVCCSDVSSGYSGRLLSDSGCPIVGYSLDGYEIAQCNITDPYSMFNEKSNGDAWEELTVSQDAMHLFQQLRHKSNRPNLDSSSKQLTTENTGCNTPCVPDECGGCVDDSGSYIYYASGSWPYSIGCFARGIPTDMISKSEPAQMDGFEKIHLNLRLPIEQLSAQQFYFWYKNDLTSSIQYVLEQHQQSSSVGEMTVTNVTVHENSTIHSSEKTNSNVVNEGECMLDLTTPPPPFVVSESSGSRWLAVSVVLSVLSQRVAGVTEALSNPTEIASAITEQSSVSGLNLFNFASLAVEIDGFVPSLSESPSAIPSYVPSVSLSQSASGSFVPTHSSSASVSFVPSATKSATKSATSSVSQSVVPSRSISQSVVSTESVSQSAVPSESASRSAMPSESISESPSSTSEPSSTNVPSYSTVPTSSNVPSTSGSTVSKTPSISESVSTSTAVSASALVSGTTSVSVSGAASISVSGTAAVSGTVAVSVSETASISVSGTASVSLSGTASISASISSSSGPLSESFSGSRTPSLSVSSSKSESISVSSSRTATVSNTASKSQSTSITVSGTVTISATTSRTVTQTPSVTTSTSRTPTSSRTPTRSITATPSPTRFASSTPTRSVTPSGTASSSVTPSETASNSVTPSISATPSTSQIVDVDITVVMSVGGVTPEDLEKDDVKDAFVQGAADAFGVPKSQVTMIVRNEKTLSLSFTIRVDSTSMDDVISKTSDPSSIESSINTALDTSGSSTSVAVQDIADVTVVTVPSVTPTTSPSGSASSSITMSTSVTPTKSSSSSSSPSSSSSSSSSSSVSRSASVASPTASSSTHPVASESAQDEESKKGSKSGVGAAVGGAVGGAVAAAVAAFAGFKYFKSRQPGSGLHQSLHGPDRSRGSRAQLGSQAAQVQNVGTANVEDPDLDHVMSPKHIQDVVRDVEE